MTVRWNQKDRLARPEFYREGNRAQHLRRAYGMTAEEYDQKRAEQNFRCAACGRHESEIPVRIGGRPRSDGTRVPLPPLVVDHCHRTGAVRKLLCDRCNRVMGAAGDDLALLQAIVNYLNESEVG